MGRKESYNRMAALQNEKAVASRVVQKAGIKVVGSGIKIRVESSPTRTKRKKPF